MAQPVTVKCKTCDTGYMQHKNKYRMSGPVVVVGYIFMIPALLGMAGALIMFIAAGSATAAASASDEAAVAGAIGTAFSMFLFVGSFVGGGLGYLLTMRKKVLQCNACEATVQAS